MKPSERQHLLRIVEALCEGLATADDAARLEELVLRDAEARRLYVEAINLHGELFWDAAGAGSEETNSLDPNSLDLLSPSTTIAPAPVRIPSRWAVRRWATDKRISGLLAAGTAALLLVCLWLWPAAPTAMPQPVAVTPPKPAVERSSVETSSTTSVPEPVQKESTAPASMATNTAPVIPEITLPAIPVDSPEEKFPVEPTPLAHAAVETVPTTDAELVRLINEELRRVQTSLNVTPVGQASDTEWVRRVYLDLTGRIPTLAETESFLKDSHPQKRVTLVDHLLASPGFSHHQARVWTNLLVGRTRNKPIRREELLAWMTRQFQENRPWRETVQELIAAEGTESEGPANFLLAHLNNQAVPATAIASRILLCQQLQCVQCHQHPSVKGWNQSEFWELNAFFQQTRIKESTRLNPKTKRMEPVRELVNEQKFGPTFYETLRGVMLVAYPRYGGVEVMAEQSVPLREQLAELLFSEARPQPARAFVNRTWAQFFGYGFTTPLDDMGPQTPVSHPELLERLTAAFVTSDYDVRRLVRWICLSEAYHLGSQLPKRPNADAPEAGERPLFSRMYLKTLTAEQLHDSLLIASGKTTETLLNRDTAADRERWLARFYTAVETEENGEENTFDGSLPQALVMINGDMIQSAIDPEKNQVLGKVVSNWGMADTERIRQLSLAALSRYPTTAELSELRDALRWSVKQRVDRNVPLQVALAEGLKDVYWAYLNSSEFAVNH